MQGNTHVSTSTIYTLVSSFINKLYNWPCSQLFLRYNPDVGSVDLAPAKKSKEQEFP